MIKFVKPVVILIVLLALAANGYFYMSKDKAPKKPTLTPAQTDLIKIGAKCLDFGERSVADDIPIIEFQMVVRLAKKTTTISNCMTDNGYQQNPAWLEYAQPIAKTQALRSKLTGKVTSEKTVETSKEISGEVSESEALTNLSRADMQIFEPKDHPPYWVKQ